MKAILAAIICLSVLIPVQNCLAADPVPAGNESNEIAGRITESLDKKFKMLLGDRVYTNLGTRVGVIKGDILTIYHDSDTLKASPIGKCAVTEIFDAASVCEIIEMKQEIGRDIVTLPKIAYDDALIFPSVFALMTKVVEPYKPEKKITVYIYDVFDENNNVTEFSQKIKAEVTRVFLQKKRIKQAGSAISPALFAYLPGDYNEHNSTIEDYLKKDKIDVIISGTYKVIGDKIQISFYKIDTAYEDIIVDTIVPFQPYTALTAKVVKPYKERRKPQIVNCDVIFKPVYHKIASRDDRDTIIASETRHNPILEYTLRRSEFNIVAPVDLIVTVDGNDIKFDRFSEFRIPLTTGEHNVTASFKKGFYYNDTFLVSLPDVNRKSAVISVEKPEDLVLEVQANPMPNRENLVFNVYRKVSRSQSIIKPVLKREILKPVEIYKD
ncbi:MAG: hypothetical protein ACYDHW_08875 [Syntrophorhabdaceae bacterium]